MKLFASARLCYLIILNILLAGCGLASGPDRSPPQITPPADIELEATAPLTSVTLGKAQAIDAHDGELLAQPDQTGPFAVGRHQITWHARDAAGNQASAIQVVSITDHTPPEVIAPPLIQFSENAAQQPNLALGNASANDLVSGVVPATPSSTGPFPLGEHIVTWRATDTQGNTGTATQIVKITQHTQQQLEARQLVEVLKKAQQGDDSALKEFLIKQPKVQQSLKNAELNYKNGEIVAEFAIERTILEDGCLIKAELEPTTATLTLRKDTELALKFNKTHSLAVDLNLDGNLKFDYKIKVHSLGLLFCWKPFSESLSGTINGEFVANNTVYADITTRQQNKTIFLDVNSGFKGKLEKWNFDVSLKPHGLIVKGIDLLLNLEKKLKKKLNNGRYTQYDQFVAKQDNKVKTKLDGTHEFALPILPDVDELRLALKAPPYLSGYLKQHQDEILYYLLVNDKKALNELLTTPATCTAASLLLRDMQHQPLYVQQQNQCQPADLLNDVDQSPYFTDPACHTEIAYQPTPLKEFCVETFSGVEPNSRIGNAATWQAAANQPNDVLPQLASTKWTLPYGAALQVSALPLQGKHHPFMKRFRYKTINNITNADGTPRGSGTCMLEMRVYKKDPLARNLKPLLAFHGGSWEWREAFVGIESQVSQFTEKNFIVFAPFYRLAGHADGNEECNGFSANTIIQDAEDALDWVKQYGPALGAQPDRRIAVTGQSAGAHLSAWLVVHRPQDISKGLLLYPPSDFLDYWQNAQPNKPYAQWHGRLKILENFYNVTDLGQVPLNELQANAFPALVKTPRTPPVYILHGTADSWVPSNQSVRFCNAYNGPIPAAQNNGGNPSAGVFSKKYVCGHSGGELHLFAGARHVLDLMCEPSLTCPAGHKETSKAIVKAIQRATDWLKRD